MWSYEWQKLWKNRMILSLIVGCFLVNGILLFEKGRQYDEEKRCFPAEIHQAYEEIGRFDEMQQMDYLVKELEKAEKAAELEMEESSMEAYTRRAALESVLLAVQETSDYNGYLNEIRQQAERMTKSALFADSDAFSRRNAEKILEKYRPLAGIQPKANDSVGIILATEQEATSVIAAVLVVLFSFFFVTMEREEGTMAFVRCARYGGKPLGIQKILAVLAGGAGGTFLLYVENFLIAGYMFGIGETGGWIQSLDGFLASPWLIKVLDYLILFFFLKCMSAVLIAALTIWVCLHGKSILRTGSILIGITALEYVLYVTVAKNSWLGVLKWCNLFSFMKTEEFFKTYETVNLFGYPASAFFVCGFVGICISALFLWGGIASYEKVSRAEYGKTRKQRQKKQKEKRGHGVLWYEWKKIVVINGAGAVLLFFLAGQVFLAWNQKTYFSLDELYYKQYLKELEGTVTPEKIEWVKEEGKRIRALMKEPSTPENERKLLCLPAYEQVKAQMERIGEGGIFLNENGFGYLLDDRAFLLRTGETLLIVILAFFQTFLIEKQSRMEQIWNTVPDGRRRITAKKWGILLSLLLLFTVASEGMFLQHVISAQSLGMLSAPIRYLAGFEHMGELTIWTYLGILGTLRFLAGVFAAGIIAVVSKKAKNAVALFLTSGGIVAAGYAAVCLANSMW